jgi:ferredoxin-NADP reductase
MLGLYAFFYGLAHFLTFFALDQNLSVHRTLHEVFNRPYLVIGTAGLLMMVPLALTSFNVSIKSLGPKNWKRLHRLVYLVAIAGAIHFYMLQKADKRLPWAFFIAFGILFVYRLAAWALAANRSPAAMAAATPSRWSGKLRVEKITAETPNVKTFRLAPLNGDSFPFNYQPGQHLSLTLPINGKNVYRSYTIASTPSRPGYCELTIKREDTGVASRHMHALQEGDILQIAAPSGRFTFTGNNANSVALLAAGVGITPLMAIIRYLTDHRWGGQIYLLYSSKTQSDIIFKSELDALAANHPNLHITHTLTRDPAAPFHQGRISADLLAPSPTSRRPPATYAAPPT